MAAKVLEFEFDVDLPQSETAAMNTAFYRNGERQRVGLIL
jgi:hypothetical protein